MYLAGVTVGMLMMLTISISQAAPIIVNIDSRVNGDINYGYPSVDITINAGIWLLSPTNPTIDAGALYWAWSPWDNGTAWDTQIKFQTSLLSQKIGIASWEPTAGEAFYNSANLPIEITLATSDTLRFYVLDWNLTDNIGGVSIRIDKVPTPSPVPEPTTLLLFGSGALGLLAHRRRQRKA